MQTASHPAISQRIDRLHDIPLLSGLPAEIVQKIGDRAQIRSIPAGYMIFEAEQSAESLYILGQGAVKVYRLSPAGKIVITGMIEPGGFFGELSLVEGASYGNYAEALDASIIYSIHRDHILTLFHDPRMAQHLTQMMGRRANELEYQLCVIALKPVTDRVVALLRYLNRQLADFAEKPPELHITHEELAHMVGANRESVTKVLNELQNQGIVSLHRGVITLLRSDLFYPLCQGNVI